MTMNDTDSSAPEGATGQVPECLSGVAGFLLNRAGKTILERVTVALAPLQITPRELGLLRIINSRGRLTQTALGRSHRIDRSTIVHLVDGLVEKGLVQRLRDGADKRSRLIELTPKGRKVFGRGARLTQKVQSEFLAPLSEDEWQSMRSSLLKLINGQSHSSESGSDSSEASAG